MPLVKNAPEHGAIGTALKDKIEKHIAKVAVVGLGYVGLPFAVEKGKVGFPVVGIDQNAKRAAKANQGENYIKDVKDEELKDIVAKGKFRATADFAVLSDCDVVVICVPTPLTITKDPDISYIVNVTEQIAAHLHRGQLITLESTTYPGTTTEVILPMLEESGLKVGQDFFLAFSPERVDPGNKRYTTKNTNKVVGGVTPQCLDIATTFYQQTILNVVPVSSPAVAEMTKVFENTYRAVNIALVNEMALLCDRMKIDVWEVLDAAGTKPFGIQSFYPGPGVGGHCIPIDPFYLTWKAREYEYHTRFIELAGEINDQMPYFVVDKVTRALNQKQKALNGAKILILGVAYKKDIDDVRESPILRVMELLRDANAAVSYHDPFVHVIEPHGGSTVRVESVPLTKELLAAVDCTVIGTGHSCFDYDMIATYSPVIVDTRNAMKNVAINRDRIIKL
ncbi:MAG TPA: UDP-N-acetyl-D-glucosamine dehydrogenase [Firmicutes bacterium]|jgi:UDP-N-acetyl-D-glucosamine dehydrogenase|nr:UDP-N-acetyl-D-glucosamine dehydrogenase [Bacillota bacterium]HCF92544.1 UDP-N-acetyl-D-glucosamine dehydrogenase [Bacillota bacterium]